MRFRISLTLPALAAAVMMAPPLHAQNFAASQPAETIKPLTEPLPAFSQHTWDFETYGSATVASSAGHIYEDHVGVGYFLFDGVSVNFEGVGAFITAHDRQGSAGGDFFGGGFNLLGRWHFVRQDNWSLYADGGAGILQSGESFPANGTNFNFSPQFGLGATLKLFNNVRLMGGARFQHISNADLPHGERRNPGYDSIMIYTGLMIPF